MARKLAAIAFSLGCLHASSVLAVGLGELKLESFLNQPLKANVDLLNMGGLHADEVKIRLATSEDFDKLGLERAFFLTTITFQVVEDSNGSARIVISSDEPVLEPYLDFVVEARWPSGRLLREYTVLVDPPVLSQATPVVSASQRVQDVEGSPAPAKKNTNVSASGTQVDLQAAETASGEMPRRTFNASADSSPTPGSRYMISRDDTLWAIANSAKPSGASVHQTMLDIQRLNPDAFINGNINRIKAGYIIYLPSSDEISSGDVTSALSEVREQNEAWREGRDQERFASKGPSLRISAEEETAAPGTRQQGSGTAAPAPTSEPSAAGSTAGTATSAVPGAESGDAEERLAAMTQQVETLQRIVSLKDDQIAALQGALGNTDGADPATGTVPPTSTPTEPSESAAAPEVPAAPVGDSTAESTATTQESAEAGAPGEEVPAAEPEEVDAQTESAPSAEAEVEQPPAAAPKPAPAAQVDPTLDAGTDWTSYLPYGLGALVLGIGGFLFARRRGAAQEKVAAPAAVTPRADVFSDVKLKEPKIELVPAAEVAAEASVTPKRNRGYGEHKHDEYAADVDAADALAEADIYIAYGRHPQAVDLLNNALANEPGNPVYRLKLLEIYTELNNRVAATAQLKKIRELGDPDSNARAEALMDRLQVEDDGAEAPETNSRQHTSGGPGLSPNPFSSSYDSSLEDDFSGLEIEGAEEDDLDLSGDFSKGSGDSFDDEELVIAADSNALSTKLDLARAYLDMGDDEGARQILDEVVADGTDELKAEARTLLNRIGG